LISKICHAKEKKEELKNFGDLKWHGLV